MNEPKKRGRHVQSETREGTGRARRVPMGGPDLKLEVANKDESYVYRWNNDVRNRLPKARSAAFEFVEDDSHIGTGAEDRNSDVGSYVSQVVGTNPDGSPLRAYLMRIPREFYEEDQAAKQEPIDQMERQMFEGQVQSNPNLGQGESYVPREGIKRRVSMGNQ